MSQQTHIFTGIQVAERRFGIIPEDAVIMEIWTDNNPWFTKRLMKKYPRIVAYTFLRIHSRNGNHIDARRNKNTSNQTPIIWIPEREHIVEEVIQSSNAISIKQDIIEAQGDDARVEMLNTNLQEVLDIIRNRIVNQLCWNNSITLDNWIATYKTSAFQRLDDDFKWFPFSR